ncbi:MAG: TRAP transporter small permease [Deltaproteobacteria bacterium]|nr:TRAP transporter small permease [Deltaproteobacteria bacterium]MBW2123772.1 TRAP transporter small permease [Deltaproteobacteria bacterium]
MDALERARRFLNLMLMWVAGFFLAAMILLTCANIFFRLVWMPVRGTFELMGYFGALVTAFALGYTQVKRGHIAVDILVLRFSKKTQKILNSVNYSICMVFFALVAWKIAQYGATLWETGEVTETLQIIYYPFTYGVAFGFLVLSLVFLTDLLKAVSGRGGDEE